MSAIDHGIYWGNAASAYTLASYSKALSVLTECQVMLADGRRKDAVKLLIKERHNHALRRLISCMYRLGWPPLELEPDAKASSGKPSLDRWYLFNHIMEAARAGWLDKPEAERALTALLDRGDPRERYLLFQAANGLPLPGITREVLEHFVYNLAEMVVDTNFPGIQYDKSGNPTPSPYAPAHVVAPLWSPRAEAVMGAVKKTRQTVIED